MPARPKGLILRTKARTKAPPAFHPHMKYKLLSISPEKGETNIGDYIQALASAQFLPAMDGFVDREHLKAYDDEETKMVMNGWFMHHPEQWPPSEKIHPLFVAFHINVLAQDAMLSPRGISYLRKFAPIGCRDKGTMRLLADKGVEAYFSGCMTLTLSARYRFTGTEREGIYFVDPTVTFKSQWEKVGWFFRSFLSLGTVARLYKKFPHDGYNHKFYRWVYVTKMYALYGRLFSKDAMLEATYVSQQNGRYNRDFPSDEARLSEAERLVRNYAKAKWVVTSRIHCALPCLGLETPVLFIYDDNQSEASRCRMDGLLELFKTIHWDGRRVYSEEADIFACGKVGVRSTWKNKELWRPLAEALKESCRKFVSA